MSVTRESKAGVRATIELPGALEGMELRAEVTISPADAAELDRVIDAFGGIGVFEAINPAHPFLTVGLLSDLYVTVHVPPDAAGGSDVALPGMAALRGLQEAAAE